MDRREREALDRHITGNYGEDQFRECYHDPEVEWELPTCQVSNCEEDATDGVLCAYHQKQAREAEEESDVQQAR